MSFEVFLHMQSVVLNYSRSIAKFYLEESQREREGVPSSFWDLRCQRYISIIVTSEN